MLVELVVENLAVVEKLRLRFHPGLNILTGETGSGKSLVVDALGLLFGGRASADVVRTGADRAFVSGIFETPTQPEARRILEEAGIGTEDGEIILEREVLASGKSRAFAGSRTVTAAVLKDLAPFLGDIHGQHDQQRLFSPDSQRELLDESAAHEELLDRVARAHQAWQAKVSELGELNRTEQEKLRLADLWSMQRREIEPLGLEPGEDAQLENERRVLKNVAKISELANGAYEAMSESETSAEVELGGALKKLEELSRIDEGMIPVLETLRPAQIAIRDAAHELRHYIAKLEADPAKLEEVEQRLAQIEKLKRKYGGTIEEILAFLAEVVSKLDAVESAGERRAALEMEILALEKDFLSAAKSVRESRRKAAGKLEKQVVEGLSALSMKGARFEVAMSDAKPSNSGIDLVEFLVSANPGEEPRALERVASGGELSRIALALKTAMTERAPAGTQRTLVFDEVDAGVGGAAAETVGRKLKKIAATNQVLCVTHLAQIAGFAEHHFAVTKKAVQGRTFAEVAELTGEDRVQEIGRMLSGQRLTDEALKHARKLVADYAKLTRGGGGSTPPA